MTQVSPAATRYNKISRPLADILNTRERPAKRMT